MYIVVWKIQKIYIIIMIVTQDLQLHTQPSAGERPIARSGKFSPNGKCPNGKLGQNGMSGQKGNVH